MKQLKKYSIGYNTLYSADGVISARGVKSKPNDIQIFGYTHEVGTGEKSPDNPYELMSLDSGNVNLYNPDSIGEITVTNKGIIRKGIELDASKFRSGYISIFHTSSIDISDKAWLQKGINIKFFRNGKYDTWTDWCLILNSRTEKIPEDVSKILLYETNASNGGFDIYQDLTILDSPILPTEPVTDEHSIVLSNNDMSIQVPVPVTLNSVEGVSDCICKEDRIWKLKQSTKKIDSYAGETIPTPFVSSTSALSSNATVIYQLEIPITHILSDYAQTLLNSFELQNDNEIFIEGYPDIKISGYIQK